MKNALDYTLSLINGIKDKPYICNEPKKILDLKDKITDNDFMEYYISDINKNINPNKSLILVLDDNSSNVDHSLNVKSIIDTNMQDPLLKNKYQVEYIPINLDNKTLDHLGILHHIKNIKTNNPIYINESLAIKERFPSEKYFIDPIKFFINNKKLNFDSNTSINNNKLDSIEEIKNYKKEIFDDNMNLIKFLNENPKITLIKSAGNNSKECNNIASCQTINRKLKDYYDYLTNNNYSEMIKLSNNLNQLIDSKIINNQIDFDNNLVIIKIKEKLSKSKDLSFEDFLDLSIKDNVINYQSFDLLQQSNSIINKNLHLVEAINFDTINENLEVYKKYHPNIDLSELEKELKILNLKEGLNYTPKEVEYLNKLIEKYKDIYPEIFKLNNYSSFNNLRNSTNEILNQSIDGQNTLYYGGFNGSSASGPQYMMDNLKKIELEKQKELEKQMELNKQIEKEKELLNNHPFELNLKF